MKRLPYHSIFVYSLCIDLTYQTHKREKVKMICYRHRARAGPRGLHGENQHLVCWQCRNLSGKTQATFIRQHLTLVRLLSSTAHIKQVATWSLDTRSRKVKRLSQSHPAKGEAEPRCKFWFQSGPSLEGIRGQGWEQRPPLPPKKLSLGLYSFISMFAYVFVETFDILYGIPCKRI